VLGFADDAFEDMYARVVADESYDFVGDDAWFRYSRPGETHNRGACLYALRPHLYAMYHSEAQVTKRTVLAAVPKSLSARLFVLRAVDEHIRITLPHVHWLDGCVVASAGIEMSAYMLQHTLAPQLLQVFSHYCPHDDGRIHWTDDVYEALAVWFTLLSTRYAGHLFGADMHAILDDILPRRAATAVQVPDAAEFTI